MRLHLTNSARAVLMAACSVSALGVASGARAAETAAAAPALEELVVTAQKREEKLQDVPAVVTAMGSETLESRQVDELSDLQSLVPALLVGYNYGSNLITIRGVSTNLTSGAEDPSVGLHINGVYQPRSRALDIAMIDVARVEVLEGPQGTLYGRNATGGVVNYILNGPTREFQARVTASAGNYDHYGVQGVVSGPVSDKVSVRLVGMWDDQSKGYVKNLAAGAPPSSPFDPSGPPSSLFSKRVGAVSAAVRFDATDTFRLDLAGFYVNTKAPFSPTLSEPTRSAFLLTRLVPTTFAPHAIYIGSPLRYDTEDSQVSATAAWGLGSHWELKSITAYQTYINHQLVDYDAAAYRAQEIRQATKSNTITQEFDLTGRSFDDRLTSIFGFFYLDDQVKAVATSFSGVTAAPFTSLFQSDQKATSYSFFTDQTFSITPKLRVIGGLRYNHDKKDMTQTVQRVGSAPTCPGMSGSLSWSSWTPRFGAQFDVAPNVMTYVTWQKGFKSGGFAANTCLNSYDPEKINGFEGGVKSEFWDHRARLNVAAYTYKYSNLQVQKLIGIQGFAVENAAAARLKGVEATFEAAITDRLRLNGSGLVQSAKYTDFLNCNQAEFLGACGATTDPRPLASRSVQVAGNWLNRAPPYKATLGVEYTLDVLGGDLLLRAESEWSGKVRYNEFNTANLTQGAYNVQNFYATYTPPDSKFKVRAFMKNVGDKNYIIHGNYNSSIQAGSVIWAPPRTYGAEVTAQF